MEKEFLKSSNSFLKIFLYGYCSLRSDKMSQTIPEQRWWLQNLVAKYLKEKIVQWYQKQPWGLEPLREHILLSDTFESQTGI